MKRIKLSQGKFALIDDEDFERVSKHKWSVYRKNDRWYAMTVINKKTVLMHRFILNPKSGQSVDHRNHNGIDNRKKNTRVCKVWQNNVNRLKKNGTTSKFKGVCWHKGRKKWAARIKRNDKHTFLGHFTDEVKAAIAYNKAATKLFGEFAHLNVIPSRRAS